MGACPSREAQRAYLKELLSDAQHYRPCQRQQRTVVLIPITKEFMHITSQPSHLRGNTTATEPHRLSSIRGSNNSSASHGFAPSTQDEKDMDSDDDSAANTVGSIGTSCDELPEVDPAALPFMQQLYDVYREPNTQFYARKVTRDGSSELPASLRCPTLASFYDATVRCYDANLYDTNRDMSHDFDIQVLSHRVTLSTAKRSAEQQQRPKKFLSTKQLRPVPCAICFMYPTHVVARLGSGNDSAGIASRKDVAPHGSVVLGPYCSLMVIGFVGLLPVGGQTEGGPPAMPLEPPAWSAGAFTRKTKDSRRHAARCELVTFIAKSASEQFLGRSLFAAAFLYQRQWGLAGMPEAAPVPPIRFSCYLMDVPLLSFLREVRLRGASFGWTRRLARALRRIHIHWPFLEVSLDEEEATQFCALVATRLQKDEYRPPPSVPRFIFAGFVNTVDALPNPSSAKTLFSLPVSESAEVKALLLEVEKCDAELAMTGRWNGSLEDRSSGSSSTVTTVSASSLDVGRRYLVCIVVADRLTVSGRCCSHGTVLERLVDTSSGAFVDAQWEVAVDRSKHEPLATDFDSPTPETSTDFSVSLWDREGTHSFPTVVASDVILSWAKRIYTLARFAHPSDPRWLHCYAQDHYAAPSVTFAPHTPPSPQNLGADRVAPRRGTAAQGKDGNTEGSTREEGKTETGVPPPKIRYSPLTEANLYAGGFRGQGPGRPPSSQLDGAGLAGGTDQSPPHFYVWKGWLQGCSFFMGLVPKFVRDRRLGQTSSTSPAGGGARYGAAKGGAARSVDATSETDVSSAASAYIAGSISYSGCSSRSGEVLRTGTSLSLTMSNLQLDGVSHPSSLSEGGPLPDGGLYGVSTAPQTWSRKAAPPIPSTNTYQPYVALGAPFGDTGVDGHGVGLPNRGHSSMEVPAATFPEMKSSWCPVNFVPPPREDTSATTIILVNDGPVTRRVVKPPPSAMSLSASDSDRSTLNPPFSPPPPTPQEHRCRFQRPHVPQAVLPLLPGSIATANRSVHDTPMTTSTPPVNSMHGCERCAPSNTPVNHHRTGVASSPPTQAAIVRVGGTPVPLPTELRYTRSLCPSQPQPPPQRESNAGTGAHGSGDPQRPRQIEAAHRSADGRAPGSPHLTTLPRLSSLRRTGELPTSH